MSKFIKYHDFVQVNPDERILSLDKDNKTLMIDNLLQSIEEDKKGLIITYDLSHSGRRINNRIYSTKGQQKGIDSLTDPYPKPILKNHNQTGEPIGRFVGGEWQSLNDIASDFLNSDKAMLDVHGAFSDDDPEKIYKTLKSLNLLDNKQWPGLGRMRVQANITDEEAIKKFLDGRYMTFSAGSTTDRHVCSICNQDWVSEGMCEHRHGKMYDGEICVFITGDFIVLEGSVVNTPADDLSQIVSMELSDNQESNTAVDSYSYPEEIMFSDSNYNLGEINGLQTAKQIESSDNEKEENEEEEEILMDEKFDHQMTISESSMEELHKTGVTYVTQSAGKESMIIKINYSGSMRKESVEKDFELFENEISELVEELIDAKTFKVPAGAKGNAQKVLKWKKEKGSEVKGMTPVGWARARQLATKSEIGLSTVRRMAAFNRHRKNAAVDPKFKSEPWKDRGYVAWLGWGGTSGIDWAVRTSAANKDSLIEDAYKSSPKGKGAKTPAEPSERIKGSKKNKKGSASKANSKIAVGSVLETLKEKLKSHNAKYGKQKGKRVSLGMLKAVYRRGVGAFSSTHRPSMSRSGWGVARVNAFLKLVKSGRPSNPKYTQDNDLLPAGHLRKSSQKQTKNKKDFFMNEEFLELESDSDDSGLEVEVSEPTLKEQEEHDESFSEEDEEETLDSDNSIDIDWNILDLALQATMAQAGSDLSVEDREQLDDAAFCGPDRSFPIPDCTHVDAAKTLITSTKLSDQVKDKVLALIDERAETLACDSESTALKSELSALKNMYQSLEEKFKTVINFIENNKSNKNDTEDNLNENGEKSEDTVEKADKDELIVDKEEKVFSLSDKVLSNMDQVTSPSAHANEEEHLGSKSRLDTLGAFEQKIVKEYKAVLSDHGKDAASSYLYSKSNYLPRGFNPNNF
mgnify:CR=1 FL=1|tara:strand:- start:28318 stop:31065 length:2748 start_codon:yes stop_codon:yes gene_type:complete